MSNRFRGASAFLTLVFGLAGEFAMPASSWVRRTYAAVPLSRTVSRVAAVVGGGSRRVRFMPS